MADKDRNEEQQGFKVTDHRRIHLDEETGAVTAAPDDGEARAREPARPTASAKPAAEPAARPADAAASDAPPRPSQAAMDEAERRADDAAARGPRHPAPEMDFTTFVLSLGSSALVHLGDAAHPDTGKAEPNLIMAKQTIDMLAMLRDKTKGNLDHDEASYLDALLYDLRMRYVEASKRRG